MGYTPDNLEEIARRARAIYDTRLRRVVEPAHNGKFLVLNVETEEYEIDADDLTASRKAESRFPGAMLFTFRIGHPTAYRLGAARKVGPG